MLSALEPPGARRPVPVKYILAMRNMQTSMPVVRTCWGWPNAPSMVFNDARRRAATLSATSRGGATGAELDRGTADDEVAGKKPRWGFDRDSTLGQLLIAGA